MHGQILVVEDSDELRELLVLLLEAEGFTVSACENADQAFAMVRQERPDLILTDLMLGATSGLDLITRVRSDLAPPIPPILACSGFADFERESIQRGAVAFLPKPFDATTLRMAVATVLTRREIAKQEREEAALRSNLLRAKAIEAARAARSRLGPHTEELIKRSQWTTTFLPRYFGFGEAFVTLFRGDELLVSASSSDQMWKRGQVVNLPLCRDILATNSALLVPDLLSIGSVALGPHEQQLRFFAGVPLSAGGIAVGTLCFVDTEAHGVSADAYSVLEAFGRRFSALLSGQESNGVPMWAPSGLLSRDGLGVVLAAELSQMQREPTSLGLLAFEGGVPGVRWHERTAIGELGERRFGALIARPGGSSVGQALFDFVASLAHADSFSGGGLINVEDGAASSFDARDMLRAAEGLLETALRTAPRAVERILIRREPRMIKTDHTLKEES